MVSIRLATLFLMIFVSPWKINGESLTNNQPSQVAQQVSLPFTFFSKRENRRGNLSKQQRNVYYQHSNKVIANKQWQGHHVTCIVGACGTCLPDPPNPGDFGSKSGIIQSRWWPMDYGSNLNCLYKLTVNKKGCTLVLTFIDYFVVEQNFDFVTVSPSSFPSFTGYSLPPVTQTTGLQMTVRFTADCSNCKIPTEYGRWKAKYQLKCPKQYNTRPTTTTTTEPINTEPTRTFTEPAWTKSTANFTEPASTDPTRDYTEPIDTDEPTKYFTDPTKTEPTRNFTGEPVDTEPTKYFTETTRIEESTTIFTETTKTEPTTIFTDPRENATISNIEKTTEKECLWKDEPKLTAPTIEQKIDNELQDMKIKIEKSQRNYFSRMPNHAGQKGLARSELLVICNTTKNCGACIIENDFSGIIQSPGFPLDYGANLFCNYTLFVTNRNFVLELEFLDFIVEKGFDAIKVQQDKTGEKFTGYDLPPIISNKSTSMMLLFYADYNNCNIPNGKPGRWQARYRARPL